MDSLTQAVLGATVGYAVGGRQLGRKAALWGIGLGTLPDLDVLVQYVDPIESFVKHRSWSHSLLVTSLATAPIGLLISWIHSAARAHPLRMISMVWLIFFTHIMLDAMTTYGTQIFWLLSDLIPSLPQEPIGVGSISIIDPVYTVPLLIATIWILVRGARRPDGRPTLVRKVSVAALAVSTLYLGWGLFAQNQIEQQVKEQMASRGVTIDRMFTTPTFGNSVLWYVLVREGDKVHYGLRSLLEDRSSPLDLEVLDRNSNGLQDLPDRTGADTVIAFSKGFYRYEISGGTASIADLRMGYPPNFVFNFVLAERKGPNSALASVTPPVHERGQFDERLFAYLWDRMFDAQAAEPQ